MHYYIVKYTGPFGYIKPWTAVRDELTYSEKFLAPATIQGISQKLFGLGEKDRVLRYRLCFGAYSVQQEQTWAKKPTYSRTKQSIDYRKGILNRGVLLEPELYLAFGSEKDADIAAEQHICLCRNEDLLWPDLCNGKLITSMSQPAFDELPGFELVPTEVNRGIPTGRNRFEPGHPMTYGELTTTGNPIRYSLY
ncbi:MAG: hypothetical protein KF690_00715 [Bacteroidetes bacterium]|nr:hypothetical protein [Bacteroidota bacterium]